MSKTHYVFVTGGVVSSLGKGITTAALGTILEVRGLSLRFLKLDPYLNIDPGTLSPYQHGEVFVTEDGTETDLDLGHYERFTHVKTTRRDHYTAGRIYAEILRKERHGQYLGNTVQTIPHVTDAIKQVIQNSGNAPDITLVEVGGTVGDIESLPFLEAIRQLRIELGHTRTYFIHLTLLPYLSTAGEIKTKPTQHSTRELLSIGIQPDMLICRSIKTLPDGSRQKIALFSNVDPLSIISVPDVDNIYQIPFLLHQQKVDTRIVEKLALKTITPDLSTWARLLSAKKKCSHTITIALVGKYTELADAYKSISEAFNHAAIHTHTHIKLQYIEAEKIPVELSKARVLFSKVDAMLVPGGFGKRGVEGKIVAARYAREHKIPYLGICLGMQAAIIEFARHCANLANAHSTECNPNTTCPIIALVTEWKNEDGATEKRGDQSIRGGTLRLGNQTCYLVKGSRIADIYGSDTITERHRHRYEVNGTWVPMLEKLGLRVSGKSTNGLVETIELIHHPWFIGCQFHPEFSSSPKKGHPLFISFVRAASAYQRGVRNT